MKSEQIQQMDKLFTQGASLRQVKAVLESRGEKIGVSGVNYHKKKMEKAKGRKYPSRYLTLEQLKELL